MDNETANALYDKLGSFVILGLKQSIEFGVDLNLWQTSPSFTGLKLIPPGLHLISYSSIDSSNQIGMKSCFFHLFKPGELVVKEWNPATEALKETKLSSEQLISMKTNLRDLDSKLGAYPSGSDSTLPRWSKLTNFITAINLAAAMPTNTCLANSFNSATSSCYDQQERIQAAKILEGENEKADLPSISKDQVNQRAAELSQFDTFQFRLINLKKSFDSSIHTPFQISQFSMDKSFLLKKTLSRYPKGSLDLLAEMQLSFVILLVGQNFNGLEHYKMIVALITGCEIALDETMLLETLFIPFVRVLKAQLLECPSDFFTSVLTMDNFLIHSLKNFIVNVGLAEGNSKHILALKRKVDKLRVIFQQKFDLELPTAQEILTNLENDPDSEYAPSIV